MSFKTDFHSILSIQLLIFQFHFMHRSDDIISDNTEPSVVSLCFPEFQNLTNEFL